MYETNTGITRNLTGREMSFYLIISLILNSMGNGLTVACNLGSAMWTASAANLALVTRQDISFILILYGILVIGLNIILLGHLEWPRIIGNLLFIGPFGFFVSLWASWFGRIGVGTLNYGVRLGLDVLGIILLAIAVSIYQRVNLILHPNDDMTNIIRFKYVHGNPILAQLLNFTFPLTIIIIIWIVERKIVAFNIGTLFAFLCQGAIIGWSDQYIFTYLKHRINTLKQQQPIHNR
ncbi:hypothetical protein [Periweissella beninensis]|uniref:hypothetical protein n=1 Tax=Periweissella beninensis TaxID=504936 RepID=UPI0021A75CE8|nr:hypothetical protein [Periweissella beninensis]MCT4395490.1 hypothetical protein [Periweissella beninensis]